MTSRRVLVFTALVVSATAVHVQVPRPAQPFDSAQGRPMSFDNRLLLNRAVIAGLTTLEVMVATTPGDIETATALVARIGGTVKYTAVPVGYLRADVPTERLIELVSDPGIDAYQIASRSGSDWYIGAQPRQNAELFRGFETTAPAAPPDPPAHGLPALSPATSRDPGYTADDDVGLRVWRKEHPTFDGRGVTIAIIESGRAEFTHPAIGTAKTLDGRDIPKLAGIVNTVASDQPDDTRVRLDVGLEASSAWQQVGGRTYIMPRAGRFRFGLFTVPAGANLVHQFGVLKDSTSGETWVDANGNADFSDEDPVSDVNVRFEPRLLKLTHPRPLTIAFVAAQGRDADVVHIYLSRNGHQAMTLGIAAGSAGEDGLAAGVAPGARALLVRIRSTFGLRDVAESFIETVARPDVDMVSASLGIGTAPDTGADFMGLLFSRIVAAYGKPIFLGAGNRRQVMSVIASLGDVFTVGGSISPETFATLYGGGAIDGSRVHPYSSAGPAMDGALKPDFLAPVHRIAPDVWTSSRDVRLPRNAPTMYLPRGYQISCCTSASAPFAAGIGALLISAARQQGIAYSVPRLGRALRVGARFLPRSPAYEQGNGVLDVNEAWRELSRSNDVPRIRAEGPIVHPLAEYSIRGSVGEGLYERDGWTAGTTGVRQVRFYRETGSPNPETYRIDWIGNDGTFAAPQSITLPLQTWVSLPINIAVKTPGAHSALLALHDTRTGATVTRMMATIVAAHPVRDGAPPVRLEGTVPLMGSAAHYFALPNDAGLLDITLEVVRGSVAIGVLPSHGLYGPYYSHVYPGYGWTYPKGTYRLGMERPAAGTWGMYLSNATAFDETNRALVSTGQAEYAITIRVLSASVAVRHTGPGAIAVDLTSVSAEIREPIIQTSVGTRRSYRGQYLANGLPNVFDVDVPRGAETLMVEARALDTARLEVNLYECTSGECFSYDYTVPAVAGRTLVVPRPRPGRWKVAISAAPHPSQRGAFTLDHVVTMGPRQRTVTGPPRLAGDVWSQTVAVPPKGPNLISDGQATRVLLIEVLDNAVERETNARPWVDGGMSPESGGRTGLVRVAVHPLD
jgi:hypothetical protein